MSFPKYPEVKDLGVEWLGEVPAHWEIQPLKRHCDVMPSNVDKKSVDEEQSVFLCNYTDVYYNESITYDLDFMRATAAKGQVDRFSLKKGDVVFTKDSESSDDIAIAAHIPATLPGVVCGYHLAIARPHPSLIGKFLKRYFDSHPAKAYFRVSANGLTRVGLGQYACDNLPTPIPPRTEQAVIAAFLDHETARIDVLVNEQQRLIELLKEKRQAVISHAVTKGLDPYVPMKDSGVEWLGEVPANWEFTRIGWITSELTYDFTNPMPKEDDGPKMLTANDIGWGEIFYDTARNTSEFAFKKLLTDKSRPRRGDLLLTKDGTLGRVAVHDGQPACINQSVALIRTFRVADSDFLCSLLQATCYQSRMMFEAGGTTIKHIYITRLAKMPVALPPMHEQCKILEKINHEDYRYKSLIAEAEKSAKLLVERRSALISAAVTGKIDVRGWQPPMGFSPCAEVSQTEVV